MQFIGLGTFALHIIEVVSVFQSSVPSWQKVSVTISVVKSVTQKKQTLEILGQSPSITKFGMVIEHLHTILHLKTFFDSTCSFAIVVKDPESPFE